MRPFLKKTKRIYNKKKPKRTAVFSKSKYSKEDIDIFLSKNPEMRLKETYLNYQLYEV
jgi:hypothetical protein